MHVFAVKGINLAQIMADDLLKGKPLPVIREDVPDTAFASEKVLLEEYASGDISRAEMEEETENADALFIRDEQDPMPYRHYKKYLTLVEAFRKVKKAKS